MPINQDKDGFDYDWVIVGSGFGGSVSAMRLAEKGYRVLLIERGKRFEDKEFPKSTWRLRKYIFEPRLGLHGIVKVTPFKDITVLSGAGVGGGSLGYAMTLYVPPQAYFDDPQWKGLADWHTELAPHYETAQRMLGVAQLDEDDEADQLLLKWAKEKGVEKTYRKARVGAYIENEGEVVADPYFGGAGPERMGCTRDGRCMQGCVNGSKNDTRKNYLYFAEKLGVTILPEREVVGLIPLDEDGESGWTLIHKKTGARRKQGLTSIRARGVVLAGGAVGTNELLARAKLAGTLPRLSDRLGELVRTNSEAILAVTTPPGRAEALTKRLAITSSVYPDPATHIETVTYGKGGGSPRVLFTMLTGDGTRLTRPAKWIGQVLRHPVKLLKLLFQPDWAGRTVVILVMQTLDNAIAIRSSLNRKGELKMQTEQDESKPNPTFIPVANQFAEWLAKEMDGTPTSMATEAILNIPTTAHFLGGAVIGADESRGVVDKDQRVFGYKNLLVCDGAAVPANVGVNPSLTITAMTERAIAKIPAASPEYEDVVPFGSKPIEGRVAVEVMQPMP